MPISMFVGHDIWLLFIIYASAAVMRSFRMADGHVLLQDPNFAIAMVMGLLPDT